MKQNSNKNKIITEKEIIQNHYRFLRESDQESQSAQQDKNSSQVKLEQRQRSREKNRMTIEEIHQQYGEKMAKKYEDKLFKQFALVDLSRYQSGQIGCRWRTQKQVRNEKGQKLCGQIACKKDAKSVYQMNFGYMEQGKKKNALVKISVCRQCEIKLNWKKQLKKVVEKVKKQEQEE